MPNVQKCAEANAATVPNQQVHFVLNVELTGQVDQTWPESMGKRSEQFFSLPTWSVIYNKHTSLRQKRGTQNQLPEDGSTALQLLFEGRQLSQHFQEVDLQLEQWTLSSTETGTLPQPALPGPTQWQLLFKAPHRTLKPCTASDERVLSVVSWIPFS